MALPPKLYNAKYHIADTILKRQIDRRQEKKPIEAQVQTGLNNLITSYT